MAQNRLTTRLPYEVRPRVTVCPNKLFGENPLAIDSTSFERCIQLLPDELGAHACGLLYEKTQIQDRQGRDNFKAQQVGAVILAADLNAIQGCRAGLSWQSYQLACRAIIGLDRITDNGSPLLPQDALTTVPELSAFADLIGWQPAMSPLDLHEDYSLLLDAHKDFRAIKL